MTVARFKVFGRLDGAGGARQGTLSIDRAAGLVHVRPYKRQRVYTMPLSMVADMICMRIIMNELADRRAAKAKGKKGKRT